MNFHQVSPEAIRFLRESLEQCLPRNSRSLVSKMTDDEVLCEAGHRLQSLYDRYDGDFEY